MIYLFRVALLFLLSFTHLHAISLKEPVYQPQFLDAQTPELNCHTPACLQLQQLVEAPIITSSGQNGLECQLIDWQLPPRQIPTHQASCYRQETPVDLNLQLRYQPLVQETRNFFIMSWGMMLAIYALPEDVSNWERSEMTPDKLPGNWQENMQEAPVWDKDDWQLNYVNHPYIGSMYYIVARNHGLPPFESFSYSFWMSALMWEFGVESTAEPASIQDTLVTPIAGSILGEMFYVWEQRILENEGLVLGSPFLGSTSLFLLNPAGTLSGFINQLADDQNFIKESRASWVIQSGQHPLEQENTGYVEPAWVGLQLDLRF
ncbi:protein of unknown function [Marinospirillum celere]|uniref:DUF3943 domain-containing protein n=1 Tax=Marinospirillum celere TaxID=1122252 RepID=A0A1I1INH1_9GAMM|nr:DUF3943 domain-containing protein [Marinospirillum celere]SFC37262.1 protein of unknown function [Marinospirillum celere]